MLYLTKYESILGELTLVSDEENLVGLWIEGQKHFMGKLAGMDVVELDLIEADEDSNIAETFQMRENVLKARNILECVKTWLEQYFTGENPMIDIQPTLLVRERILKMENSYKLLGHILGLGYNFYNFEKP